MDSYQALADQFRRVVLSDPVVQTIMRGYILWGDIPVTQQEIDFHAQWAADHKSDLSLDVTLDIVSDQVSDQVSDVSCISHDVCSSEFDTSDEWITPHMKIKTNCNMSVPTLSTTSTLTTVTTVSAVPIESVGIRTLVLRNLPRDTTLQSLRALFSKYGPILDIRLMKNRDPSSPFYGTLLGCAFIKFLSHSHSAAAFLTLAPTFTLSSQPVSILFAKLDK